MLCAFIIVSFNQAIASTPSALLYVLCGLLQGTVGLLTFGLIWWRWF
jgi:uncharacterized membrane protein YuzA (DUF378 family)